MPLLDLGYIAFYAVGAYTFAFLASPHFGCTCRSGVCRFGRAFARWPGSSRLSGAALRDYLAIVTPGFGEIVRIFMNNLNYRSTSPTAPGHQRLDPMVLFGWDLAQPHHRRASRSTRCSSTTTSSSPAWSPRSSSSSAADLAHRPRLGGDARRRTGRQGDRHQHPQPEAAGLLAGGHLRRRGGRLFGAFQGFVSPESFSLMESIAVLTMVVFGGMGNLPGQWSARSSCTALPEILRNVAVPVQQTLFGHVILDPEVLRMLLLSLAMILMMLLRPGGLIPAHARSPRGPSWWAGGAQVITLLEARNIGKRFGGLTALSECR